MLMANPSSLLFIHSIKVVVSFRMDVSVQIQISFFLVQGQCIGISALVSRSALKHLCICFILILLKLTDYKEPFIDEIGDGGYVVCYEMVDIERKLGFGRDSLVTF